jgi:hypothetical protein
MPRGRLTNTGARASARFDVGVSRDSWPNVTVRKLKRCELRAPLAIYET